VERWLGSQRRELLDRILIVNRRQLEHVLAIYVDRYNTHRPHRSLSQTPPAGRSAPPPAGDLVVRRRRLVDDPTRARARGLVVSGGVIALPYYRHTNPAMIATAHTGIQAVLADAN
jgi:hypothetical protein